MSIDEDFAAFVTARWAALYRLAYCSRPRRPGAEDLLQTTLEKAYVNWSRIGRMEYAEAYVRRMLATTLLSADGEPGPRQPWDELPEAPADSLEVPVLDRSLLWPRCARSPLGSGR